MAFDFSSSSPSSAARPIVLVSNGFQTNYERGFSNGLAALGADVTLISSDNTDTAGLLPAVRTVNLRGSQDAGRPGWQKTLNLLRYQLRLGRYLLGAGRPIVQVIGLIEPPWLYGVADGLLFRLLGARYVLTVHNLRPHRGCSARTERMLGRSYRLAHRLVVHTELMRSKLCAEFGVDAGRVTVMEHGLEPVDVASRLPARPAAGAPLRLLVFGRVNRYKGVDLLLEALAGFELPFTLDIVGASVDATLTQELRAAIAAHPHAARIVWRDEHVDEDEMARALLAADALVMPYRHIDQSGVLFQALRFGLPLVVSRVGSLASYVTPEIGEHCEPNDPASLADALRRLAARLPGLDRARIAEIGRRWEWKQTIAVAAADGVYTLAPDRGARDGVRAP